MKQLIVNGYRRVSKSTAKKLYDAGETIRLCACHMRPTALYTAYCDANKKSPAIICEDGFQTVVARNKNFDTIVLAYTCYNCNANSGKYPAYYIKEGKQNENI